MARATALIWLVLLCLPSGAAAADPRVPRIPDRDLPVAGTCAPIQTADVTYVTNGPRTDLKWFGVSGLTQPVDYRGLVATLQRRVGPVQPSRHAVWVTASAGHAWAHAIKVVQACAAAGIYRVGLRVRSESTGEVLGFPLFLPPAQGARMDPTRAGRLEVRVTMVPEKKSERPSDVGHVYAAVGLARKRGAQLGVARIVAELSLPVNAPLQYAVTALDLLYRGGCAGVALRGGLRLPKTPYKLVPKIEVQGRRVVDMPQDLKPPPVRPRTAPWPVHGAGQPGWVDLTLVDLDGDAGPDGRKPRKDVPVNYAASANGVPADVRRRADAQARTWAHALGRDLLDGLRGGQGFVRRFAVRLRRPEVFKPLIEGARRTFPDATAVVPSTLRFNALLFDKGRAHGRADVTIHLAGRQLGVIFGNWRSVGGNQAFTLPPLLVDPFARGEPGNFRVWFEAAFGNVRRLGSRGLPLAPPADVLRFFPPVAQQSVQASLGRRGPSLQALAGQIQGSRFDRVVLSVQQGTATVFAGRTVVGVLNFSLTAEEQELRLDDLRSRRAP